MELQHSLKALMVVDVSALDQKSLKYVMVNFIGYRLLL